MGKQVQRPGTSGVPLVGVDVVSYPVVTNLALQAGVAPVEFAGVLYLGMAPIATTPAPSGRSARPRCQSPRRHAAHQSAPQLRRKPWALQQRLAARLRGEVAWFGLGGHSR